MSDEVKFIFKTLLKVPVIILVSFMVLNIFAFFFIYFKVLGLSYVIMQTAVENNYLPVSELSVLCEYVHEFEDIPMVTNSAIIVAKSGNTYSYVQSPTDMTVLNSTLDYDGDGIAESDASHNAEGSSQAAFSGTTKNYIRYDMTAGTPNTALKKQQYGKKVTVGAHCGYKLVWPLSYEQTFKGDDARYGGNSGQNPNGVQGLKGTGTTIGKTDAQLLTDREDKATIMNFDICYTVPGLRYYPDLLTY